MKTVLITGGSRGIGRAMVELFSKEGYSVAFTYKNSENEAKSLAEKTGAFAIRADSASEEEVLRAVRFAEEHLGGIGCLINNAGVLDNGLKAIDSFTDDDMNKVIDINTKGTMCMTREVAVEMAKTGYGSIVNVASVAGVMGCGGAAYVASKAAVIGLTRHTALRFAGTNVRCNAICPGTIVTPMVAGMNPANMDMNIFGQMMKHNDLKVQPCMPEDVANMLLFFASDESRAITGQTIVTDFGSTL